MDGAPEWIAQLNWRAFLLAMLVVELTPGPNMGWLAALSAQHGIRVGCMAVLGISLGLAVQVLAAATGVATAISHLPFLYDGLRWAGVLFMLWLAWQAFAEAGSTAPAAGFANKGFRRGLIANVLNPKALVFYVVIVGQFIDPGPGSLWWQILFLGALHLGIATAVHLTIVLAAATMGHALEQWRRSLYARVFFSLSLVAIAVWIAFSTA